MGQRPELGGVRALVFEVLEDAGPQAPQRFLVGVRLGTRLLSSCRGKNQKLASTAAAQHALGLLESEDVHLNTSFPAEYGADSGGVTCLVSTSR